MTGVQTCALPISLVLSSAPVGLPCLSAGIQDQLSQLVRLLNLPFAMDVIILIAWAIWNTRNAYVSRRELSPVSLPADVGSGRSFSGYFYLRAKRKSYPTLPDCQIPLVACAGKYSTIDNVLLFRTKQRNQFYA